MLRIGLDDEDVKATRQEEENEYLRALEIG
jgi:hypothetical protein